LFGDPQTNAKSASSIVICDPLELLEDADLISLGNADTLIGHYEPSAVPVTSKSNTYRPASAISDSVGNNVLDHLLNGSPVKAPEHAVLHGKM